MARRVAIIGGGLAGITSAIALRDAGVEVTLLESRPWLGGAASSFTRDEIVIDTGQHVFLRCCSYYQELLARLGVTGSVTIQDRFDVTVLSPEAGPARLRRSSLPSPLHLSRALLSYPLLSLAERAKVGRAALAFRLADPRSPGLDNHRLGAWLARRGQDEGARRRLWDLFIVSALNIDGDEASVPLAATVIKTALLGRNDAADIGIATVPLGQLHSAAPADLLARIGADVRYGARVASVGRLEGGGFRVVLTEGRTGSYSAAEGFAVDEASGAEASSIITDAVIMAVPSGQAARLGATAGLSEAAAWDRLGSSPIVNVHVIYDRPVTSLPFVAAVDSPVQWVFDKTMQAGVRAGQYLAVSLSAADRYVDMPTAALRELFLPALEQLFPAAADARIIDFFVTRERRATFRQEPGSGSLRPGAATSVPGLALAGSWTDTGWPDTMEGAVRSGQNAAQVLIRELSSLPSPSRTAGLDPARTGAS